MSIGEVKKRLSRQMMSHAEVCGVGIKGEAGVQYLVVYVVRGGKDALPFIPDEVEGIDVRVEEIGDIVAY